MTGLFALSRQVIFRMARLTRGTSLMLKVGCLLKTIANDTPEYRISKTRVCASNRGQENTGTPATLGRNSPNGSEKSRLGGQDAPQLFLLTALRSLSRSPKLLPQLTRPVPSDFTAGPDAIGFTSQRYPRSRTVKQSESVSHTCTPIHWLAPVASSLNSALMQSPH